MAGTKTAYTAVQGDARAALPPRCGNISPRLLTRTWFRSETGGSHLTGASRSMATSLVLASGSSPRPMPRPAGATQAKNARSALSANSGSSVHCLLGRQQRQAVEGPAEPQFEPSVTLSPLAPMPSSLVHAVLISAQDLCHEETRTLRRTDTAELRAHKS